MRFCDHPSSWEYTRKNFQLPPELAKDADAYYKEEVRRLVNAVVVEDQMAPPEDGNVRFPDAGRRSQVVTMLNRSLGERLWYSLGCPYYKVYEPMVPLLTGAASLDVPHKYFALPFHAMVVRLPAEPELEAVRFFDERTGRHYQLQTIFGWSAQRTVDLKAEQPVQEGREHVILHLYFGESLPSMAIDGQVTEAPVTYYQLIKFGTDEQETVQEAMDGSRRMNVLPDIGGCTVPPDIIDRACRLFVSVCLLATGGDRLVDADILSSDVVKYYTLAADDEKGRARLQLKAKQRGKFGFTVGRSDAPYGPSSARPDDDELMSDSPDARGPLKYSHLRSAHFRLVRCGAGLTGSRLKFIKMTTVRPDLPLPPVGTQTGRTPRRPYAKDVERPETDPTGTPEGAGQKLVQG